MVVLPECHAAEVRLKLLSDVHDWLEMALQEQHKVKPCLVHIPDAEPLP